MNIATRISVLLVGCGASLLQGCSQRDREVSSIEFDEVSAESGFYDLASGWGLSWADVNDDGYPDLFVSNHTHYPSELYINEGGLFLVRATGSLGRLAGFDNHLGVWADFDADEDLDLYATNGAYWSDVLLENLGEEGFRLASNRFHPDRGDAGRGRSAIWADFTADGWLDLFVSNMFSADLYYRRETDGTFSEVAGSVGVSSSFAKQGAVAGDLDGDGDLDIYVPILGAQRNLLFINRGHGTFVEWAQQSGLDLGGSSAAAAFGDFDNDGLLDLYVARNQGGDVVFRNMGNAEFKNVTRESGIKFACQGVRNAGFADLDNDGDLDLFTSCGGPRDGRDAADALFQNLGDGRFRRAPSSVLSQPLKAGNSASFAFADFDLDGYLDLATTSGGGARVTSGPQFLFRNRGGTNGFLRVVPRGGAGNREGLGARVEVCLPDGKVLVRENWGTRVVAQDEPVVHFGLGFHPSVSEIRAAFPDGGFSALQGVPANETVLMPSAKPARYLGSHPAALTGETASFDLGLVRERIEKLLDGPLPEADSEELLHRQREVLARLMVKKFAGESEPSEEELRLAWLDAAKRLEVENRYWIEHVTVGNLNNYRKPDPENRPRAEKIAVALRAGEDVLETVWSTGLRSWRQPVRSEKADEEFVNGHVEAGWWTMPMLEERFGETAMALGKLSPGGVHGPVELYELREVRSAQEIRPYPRVFRLVETMQSVPADPSRFMSRVSSSLLRRKLSKALTTLYAQEGNSSSLRSFGYYLGVRYEIEPLAAAAQATGLADTPEALKALARVREEVRLNRAVQLLVENLEVSASEIEEHLARRLAHWRQPRRIVGTKLFFDSKEGAEEAKRLLEAGASFEEVTERLKLPSLASGGARNHRTHFEVVDYTRSLWQRIEHPRRRPWAGESSFEELASLAPGQASDVVVVPNGHVIFVSRETVPVQDLSRTRALRTAETEIRKTRVDALLVQILEGAFGPRSTAVVKKTLFSQTTGEEIP